MPGVRPQGVQEAGACLPGSRSLLHTAAWTLPEATALPGFYGSAPDCFLAGAAERTDLTTPDGQDLFQSIEH